jgi:hypothetical protein
MDNPDKKIIHIGGWLRNIFSFYQLHIPSEMSITSSIRKKTILEQILCIFFNREESVSKYKIRKVGLKGKGMNNYYPKEEYISKVEKMIEKEGEPEQQMIMIEKNCSQNSRELKNNWHKHMYEYILRIGKSVEIIENVTNEEYDVLLSKNIVFIHLIDASTVNTILECIARNTPIIVNRHPATIELLGEYYPLYYSSCVSSYEMNSEIETLLKNGSIKLAYEYLKKKEKTKLQINTFIQDITPFIIQNAH